MKKLHENTVPYKRTKKLSTILIAAIIVVALLTGAALAVAGFTVYENPAAMINAFFGENGTAYSEGVVDMGERPEDFKFNLPGWERVPADETLAGELIANCISGETATILWEGYTLTVEANLYDPLTESGILYFSVENPAGVSGYDVWPNGEIVFNPETISFFPRSNWHGTSYIDERMSTEEKLYICDYYTKSNSRASAMSELEITVFSYDDEKYIGREKLNSLSGREMPGLSMMDGNVIVSPIAMRIDAVAIGFDISIPEPKYVCFKYIDGSEYILKNKDAFISNQSYACIIGDRLTILFNRIVDINSLSEIVLDDIVIKVK